MKMSLRQLLESATHHRICANAQLTRTGKLNAMKIASTTASHKFEPKQPTASQCAGTTVLNSHMQSPSRFCSE